MQHAKKQSETKLNSSNTTSQIDSIYQEKKNRAQLV